MLLAEDRIHHRAVNSICLIKAAEEEEPQECNQNNSLTAEQKNQKFAFRSQLQNQSLQFVVQIKIDSSGRRRWTDDVHHSINMTASCAVANILHPSFPQLRAVSQGNLTDHQTESRPETEPTKFLLPLHCCTRPPPPPFFRSILPLNTMHS